MLLDASDEIVSATYVERLIGTFEDVRNVLHERTLLLLSPRR